MGKLAPARMARVAAEQGGMNQILQGSYHLAPQSIRPRGHRSSDCHFGTFWMHKTMAWSNNWKPRMIGKALGITVPAVAGCIVCSDMCERAKDSIIAPYPESEWILYLSEKARIDGDNAIIDLQLRHTCLGLDCIRSAKLTGLMS